jgi:hypothetical protein
MENDPAVLDPLLETESWQTLATFARESARTVILYIFYIARAHLFFLILQHNHQHDPRQTHRRVVPWMTTSRPNYSMMLPRLLRVTAARLPTYVCVHTARSKTRTPEMIARCADCHCKSLGESFPHKKGNETRFVKRVS